MRAATPHPASAEAPLYLGTYGWVRWLLALCLVCALALATGPVGAQVSVSIIQTLAGGPGPSGVPAISVALNRPSAVAIDSLGNLYITVQESHVVRKVSPDGQTTTVVAGNGTPGFSGDGGPATAAQLAYPSGVAVDGAGNVYIADRNNHRIRKVDASGAITTFAGNGILDFGGDGGPATAAQLAYPQGVAVDSKGNLHIADTFNHRIRRVDAIFGTITTIAGNGTIGFGGDGYPATAAQLNYPQGVAIDSAGTTLYIADTNNKRIRKVAAGIISTAAEPLDAPSGVAVDSAGNLYIADAGNHRIRKVNTSGTITPFAGTGTPGFSGDLGLATAAKLAAPSGVAVDNDGNLYIADAGNHRIRKVNTSGYITTFAGNGFPAFSGDDGAATKAQLDNPSGVAVDSETGNVYIADAANHRIRKVDAITGEITTIAGTGVSGFSGDGGKATEAKLDSPSGVALDSAGNLYIADAGNHRIRKVNTSGYIITFAGKGTPGSSGDGGEATAAQLAAIKGVAVDSAGNVYIVSGYALDGYAGTIGSRIRKVDVNSKKISTIAGDVPERKLVNASGIAIDGTGNVYIADQDDHRIRKVDITNKTISTIAGTGSSGFSGDDKVATAAQLNSPSGVALDSAGNLYIADAGNHRIRKVDITNNTISTIAGNGTTGFSGDGGPVSAAQLNRPTGVAVDSDDNLYIVDRGNHRIRSTLSPVLGYPITTSANPAAGGTVSCSPNPVSHGHSATCTATPAAGYTLKGFSGDCTGSTCSLNNVTSSKSVTANFTASSYPITTTADPLAGGIVICSPNPVSHGGTASCTATPATDYALKDFGGACTGSTGSTCTLSNVTSPKSVTATFTKTRHTITATANPATGGTVSCSPNPVGDGGSASCTATPAAGYTLKDFSGACTGSTCSLSNVTAAKSVTANFTQISYAITTTANPAAGGTVSCSPNPVGHGGTASCTAKPAAGYTLKDFSGACTGNTCSLSNVTTAKSVTANFTQISYAITTTANPAAGGTVSCSPNPVGHGGTASCTATPAAGYTLKSFSGACTGSTCSLSNVTAAKSVTASFTLSSYPITATASPAAGGTVVCSPNPVSHGGTASCTAKPAAGYTLKDFSGACTGNTCSLSNVTAAKSVTANFTQISYAITTTANPATGGTVSCSPNPVGHGGTASCTATPAVGYALKSFSGACTGSTCSLSNVTAAKSVTASFTETSHIITATANPAAGGTVVCSPNPVGNGGTASCTAKPAAGYTLKDFSGACTGSTCSLSNVTSPKSVTANFTRGTTQGPVLDADFVRQQYLDFLSRHADSAGVTHWEELLRTGKITRAELVQQFLASPEFQGRIAPVVRLYFAYFQRVPDYAGLQHWINTLYPNGVPSGVTIADVSQAFAGSSEFAQTYGALDDQNFVRLVYRNVLGREPDSAGLAHWLSELQRGMSRGAVMLSFSESIEYQTFSQNATQVVMTYVGMLRRSPEQVGFEYWVDRLEAGASITELLDLFLRSPEYNQRFTAP